MSAWLALALLIASCIILLLRHDVTTIGGMDSDYIAALIAMAGLFIYMVGAFLKDNRNRLPQLAQNLVVVSTLFVTAYVGYEYRDKLYFVASNVGSQVQSLGNKIVTQGIQITFPSKEGTGTVVQIRKQRDGHFIARTKVNNIELNLIVDTGATVVVLKPSDAEQVGINMNDLQFSVPVQTANGIAHAARIRLHKVAVGPLTAYDVDAFVVRRGTLQKSLLGLSFLSRLRSYGVSGNYLSLRG